MHNCDWYTTVFWTFKLEGIESSTKVGIILQNVCLFLCGQKINHFFFLRIICTQRNEFIASVIFWSSRDMRERTRKNMNNSNYYDCAQNYVYSWRFCGVVWWFSWRLYSTVLHQRTDKIEFSGWTVNTLNMLRLP